MFKRACLIIFSIILILPVFALDTTFEKLPNGQTVVVQEVHSNPIVTIDTWVRTGSINETDTNSGVSHFLEHLFFKGTKKHPVGEFDRILESKGAVVNAATSKDFTHYYITIPSAYFDLALELHADMLTNPQIPRKELEQERKVVLEEISKDANTPAKIVFNNLNEMLYQNHPYKRKVIGSSQVISTIRREEILDYFNKYYSPSNMVTVVVGDVDTQQVLEKVANAFSSEVKKSPKKIFKKEHSLFSQKRKIEYLDAQSGYMTMGFRGESISDNDIYALDVLAQILGGGRSSKLYNNIKEQKGLAFSISAFNGSFKDDGIFYINTNFIHTNLDKLEKAIFDEIEYIQKYGITEEELNLAKKTIEQDTYIKRESTSDISTEIGYIVSLTNSLDLYKNYVNSIKKVSSSDVQRVAQKYLGKNKSAVSIALPKEMQNNSEKVVEKHSAKKISEFSGAEKYAIDNGSTLILNKNLANDIVAISVIAKGGKLIENKSGESTLLAATMLKGTKKYSSQELNNLMEENGIIIEPKAEDDHFIINLQTTTAQVDLALDILNEILNNSNLDDYEIEKKRIELLNKMKQLQDIPMNIALENFKSLIFENSAYSQTYKVLEKTLPTITKKDIRDYYNKVFDSKNVVISVNGNVDSQKFINELGTMLEDKKQQEIKFLDYKVNRLKNSKNSIVSKKDLQTAWLFLGWQTAGINDEKDFATLKIINTILGGGMSSRIYKNLREQDGLAYQLGSIYSPKSIAGMFITYIGTNPESLDYSKEKIKLEIERLKMEFVSDTELQDAKDRLKGGFIIALEKNSEKAFNTGLFEAMGVGYDFLEKYISIIDSISASDIVRVANKYFNSYSVESIIK